MCLFSCHLQIVNSGLGRLYSLWPSRWLVGETLLSHRLDVRRLLEGTSQAAGCQVDILKQWTNDVVLEKAASVFTLKYNPWGDKAISVCGMPWRIHCCGLKSSPVTSCIAKATADAANLDIPACKQPLLLRLAPCRRLYTFLPSRFLLLKGSWSNPRSSSWCIPCRYTCVMHWTPLGGPR